MIEYAVKVDSTGTKSWYLNGQRHRTDGPAIEYADGDKAWYLNGQPHRVDGPAGEYASGYKSWWINGQSLSEVEFTARIKTTCAGKEVIIDGVRYRLTAI